MSQSRFVQLFYFHWIKRMDVVGIKTVYTCGTPRPPPFFPKFVIHFSKLHNACMYNVNKIKCIH